MFAGFAYTYILTNQSHTVLYTGVTTDLCRRTRQHQQKVNEKSFTAKYHCDKLIFYHVFDNLSDAIEREKKIKKRNRNKKRRLIEINNPSWYDLFAS